MWGKKQKKHEMSLMVLILYSINLIKNSKDKSLQVVFY
jgi:hypothetical protein